MHAKPELKEVVMMPYASWLAMQARVQCSTSLLVSPCCTNCVLFSRVATPWLQDRFDEARMAYKVAGRPEESVSVLEQLAHNAVTESRFADAAFYFYHLAMESLASVSTGLEESLCSRGRKPRPFFSWPIPGGQAPREHGRC